MKEYIIISGEEKNFVQEEVRLKILEGYRCVGGLSTSWNGQRKWFYQAMVDREYLT